MKSLSLRIVSSWIESSVGFCSVELLDLGSGSQAEFLNVRSGSLGIHRKYVGLSSRFLTQKRRRDKDRQREREERDREITPNPKTLRAEDSVSRLS